MHNDPTEQFSPPPPSWQPPPTMPPQPQQGTWQQVPPAQPQGPWQQPPMIPPQPQPQGPWQQPPIQPQPQAPWQQVSQAEQVHYGTPQVPPGYGYPQGYAGPVPYGTPGWGPAPFSAPPAKKSKRGLWIALSSIGIILLLICVVGGLLLASQAGVGVSQADQIKNAAQTGSQKPQDVYTRVTGYAPSSTDGLHTASANNWLVETNGGSFCQYKDGAYHVRMIVQGKIHICRSRVLQPVNFIYQMQMTLVSGVRSGLIIHYNAVTHTSYTFVFSELGSYFIERYDNGGTPVVLKKGTIFGFRKGVGQTNLIAVMARGNTYSLFVNKIYIDEITDTHWNSGNLAVFAGSQSEAAFTDMQLWNL